MKMLLKLQKKTLVLSQLVAFVLSLFVGSVLILLVSQFYLDVQPVLAGQSEVFSEHAAVVSKKISAFKSANKERIYFKAEELEELRSQDFVNEVSLFTSAQFRVRAWMAKMGNFQTELFFESVPDRYLDVDSEDWAWHDSSSFLPIVVPENYLNLYNFGFAESRGLPVVSKNTIQQLGFDVEISDGFKSKTFDSKIVAFSNKINSILVPESFLNWANKNYGRPEEVRASRILVAFNDPSDERILAFFKDHNYEINSEDLALSKLSFLFQSSFLFVFAIALLVILFSVSYILLSVNLILHKHRDLILNLFHIGYSPGRIARFYRLTISGAGVIAIVLAMLLCNALRKIYLHRFENMLEMEASASVIFWGACVIGLVVILSYNLLLGRSIAKIVRGA